MARTPGRTAARGVTLADVARYAGVSSAVVSYVVNDGPRPVAAATEQRVRDAIAVLGYRPNSHARALRNGSTGILGLVHPGSGNPFFGEYNDVIHAAANRVGVGMLTTSSAGTAHTEEALIEDLARRSVDGIIAVTSMTPADIPQLQNPGIPLIFLNCPFPVPGYLTIGPDALTGARNAVDHLLSMHGHSQVAHIAGETGATGPEERELGWRDAHRAKHKSEGCLIRTAFTLDGGYEGACALLNQSPRPSAVFVSSDLQAYGALHAIHERGLRIPEDIAVVSFDGTAPSAHTWPPLTLARQPVQAMADAALTAMLRHSPPAHHLFDMDLVIRRSCGCTPDQPVSRT